MRVLILGSGGREHALAWRLRNSPSVREVLCTPGNPGIAQDATCLAADLGKPDALADLAEKHRIDLTVAGPEAPLVAGVADAFAQRGLRLFGPSAAAARLEGSKIFAKRFMDDAGIPTARFVSALNPDDALAALARFDYPVVIKADGLAAGKGVIICPDHQAAVDAIRALMTGAYVGTAGAQVVIEEFLEGEELSFIALCDGSTYIPLRPTQDHKAAYDGDHGPNTGGMGAYCDQRLLDDSTTRTIGEQVIEPVLNRMSALGTPFRGFLYAGLMMTKHGPKVLEFNVRMGDPETQPLMLALESDFAEVLLAATEDRLNGTTLTWSPNPTVCVVMASRGYPGNVITGDQIHGIDRALATGASVFHAGTKALDGNLVTAGGRVLGVTAGGPTLAQAIENAYLAVACIEFDGMHYRHDIGAKGLKRWKSQPAT